MYITRFDPVRELRELESRFLNQSGEGSANISSHSPLINSREDEKAYYIEIDLPGVKKEDISIDLDGRVMSVSGTRNYKKEVDEKEYYRKESMFGKFQRSFTLPEAVDFDNIKAQAEDGVLEVTVPKVEEQNVKKIAVA